MTNGKHKSLFGPSNKAFIQRSVYFPRETQVDCDRIAEYMRRKYGRDTNVSEVIQFMARAVVAALDESVPDFEYPKVDL